MKTAWPSGLICRVLPFILVVLSALFPAPLKAQVAPVAEPDSLELNEDSSGLIAVLLNDSDPGAALDTSSLVLVEGPFLGLASVVPASGGQILYTPFPNANGADSFRYAICNGDLLCDSAWVRVSIQAINDPPLALSDTVVMLEGTALDIPVLANDSDPADAPLGGLNPASIQFVRFPTRGSASISISGEITYSPSPLFFGQDSLAYSVADTGFPAPGGLRDSATVYITVLRATPEALDDSASLDEDTGIWVDVLANDSDPQDNLDSASLSVVIAPLHGTALPEGVPPFRLRYDPDPDFFGVDSLRYRVCDATLRCAEAWAYLSVNPVNDPLQVLDDSLITSQRIAGSADVLANDSDPIDAPLGFLDTTSLSLVEGPLHGTAFLSGSQVIYNPDPDYVGQDSLTYRICDAGVPGPVFCDTARVRISVLPGSPEALDDLASGPEDELLLLDVLANDSDPQNNLDTVSLIVLVPPLHGLVLPGPTPGTLLYEPLAHFFGADSLAYRICDTTLLCDSAWVFLDITPVNDPPQVLPDSFSVGAGLSALLTVLLNDSDSLDPDGGLDTLSLSLVLPPVTGTALVDLAGIRYDAAPGVLGLDSLAYRVCDNGVPGPALCDTAWVYINLFAAAPAALPDSASLLEDSALVLDVLANDSDPQDNLDSASLVLITAPLNGLALVGPGLGQVSYTPAADFHGPDSLAYRICDLTGLCDSAWVYLTVEPVNDAPSVQNDTVSTDEDLAVLISPLLNDSDERDPGGGLDTASLGIALPPFHGTAVVDPATGSVLYTPEADYFGPDSFQYQVCDTGEPLPALCGSAWVFLDVLPVNDPPMAVADSSLTSEDVAVDILVLANDVDIDDASLSPAELSLFEAPVQGTAVVHVLTGVILYTPNADFYGGDRFVYRICDAAGACDTASVFLRILPVNDPPVVLADAGTTTEDTPLILDVLANDNDDRDPEGGMDATSVTLVEGPGQGLATVNPDGSVSYTPNPDFFGTDSFRYRVCDLGFPLPALCDSAWVLLDVTPVNDPPLILPDTASGLEDSPLLIDVLANDSDAEDGSPLPSTVTLLLPPFNGSALVNPLMGGVTYTPNPHYNGPDSLTYQACDSEGACGLAKVQISITSVNDPPVALDDFRSGLEDNTLLINILANDSDPLDPGGGLDPSSVLVLSGPFNGSVSLNPTTGAATYTPDLHFSGVDSFRYRVCDTGVPLPALCAEASAFILLAPVNDAPVLLDDAAATPEDNPVLIDVLSNDSDLADAPLGGLDATSVSIILVPANGSAVPDPLSGQITYTPNPGFVGVDSFRYQACDLGHPLPALCNQATVKVTVSNEAPTAFNDVAFAIEDNAVWIDVLANDTDPQPNIDTASVAVVSGPLHGTAIPDPLTGLVLYTPSPDYNGSDQFTYRICDLDLLCDQALVSITIAPVNDPPVIVSDFAVTPEDTPVTTVLIANDSDPRDPGSGINPGTLSLVTPPANGTLSLDLISGSATYTPDPNYFGTDFYLYRVCDLGIPLPALCGEAPVLVTITPVNDAPVILDDDATTDEDVAVLIDVLANDTDVEDGSPLPGSVVVISAPLHGTAVADPLSGLILYTPSLNYNGSDQFSYEACDSEGACGTAQVSVLITPVNDPPIIVADLATTPEDSPVFVPLIANDNDAADPGSGIDAASLSVLSTPLHGSLTLDFVAGGVTYAPDVDFFGADSFRYRVCDLGVPLPALCGSAMVYLTVSPVNDAPLIAADFFALPEDTPTGLDVLTNDTDVEDGSPDPSTVSLISLPLHASVSVDPLSGIILYTPELHYHGPDSLQYRACDFGGSCGTAWVLISVLPVNDAPLAGADVASNHEDIPVEVNVLANDSDPFDPGGGIDLASVVPVALPLNGSLAVDLLSGAITYTPDTHWYGEDSFSYRVCDTGEPLPALCATAWVSVTVLPVNDAPIVLDDVALTDEDTPLVVDVLSNDNDTADPEGGLNPASVSVLTAPLHGSALVSLSTGSITYTPNAGYSGPDSLTYRVCDLGFPLPSLCGQAVVRLEVSAQRPVAVDDTAATLEDTPLVLTVLANDSDPQDNIDPATLLVITAPAHGVVGAGPTSGTLLYSPAADYHGPDLLEYRICDSTGYCDEAQVNLTVLPVNDPPLVLNDNDTTPEDTPVSTLVVANDSDPQDAPFSAIDPATLVLVSGPMFGSAVTDPASGSIVYTPPPDYNGSDSYVYRVCDDGFPLPALCGEALVVITVTPVDDPITAVDDAVTTAVGTSADIAVLSNDLDPDGDIDPGSVSIVIPPQHGLAEVLASAQIRYTPEVGYIGPDSLDYRVCDLPGNCDTARVRITVDAEPPIAVNDTVEGLPNTLLVIEVLANDLPGSSPLDAASLEIVFAPLGGSAEADTVNGEIIYQPEPGFCGPDSMPYRICNEQGLCDFAWVLIDVRCIVLEAVSDASQTAYETPVQVFVLLNDSPAADPSCVQIIQAPLNGTALVLEDGSILYTPNALFSGTDCFRYSVCDSTGSVSVNAEVCVEVLELVTVQVPSAFSPNGDGYNDLLVIPGLELWPAAELVLFNRWESKVFESRGYANDWDGRWQGNGEPLPDDTYYYILRLDPDNPEGEVKSGSINIIR